MKVRLSYEVECSMWYLIFIRSQSCIASVVWYQELTKFSDIVKTVPASRSGNKENPFVGMARENTISPISKSSRGRTQNSLVGLGPVWLPMCQALYVYISDIRGLRRKTLCHKVKMVSCSL